MPGKKTRASLNDVAAKAGTDRNRVTWALRDDPKLPKEFKDKVRKAAEEVGYVKPPENQHPNSKLDQDKADKIVEGIVANKSLATIAAETGLSEHTAFKYIRGVKVPTDYPENEGLETRCHRILGGCNMEGDKKIGSGINGFH